MPVYCRKELLVKVTAQPCHSCSTSLTTVVWSSDWLCLILSAHKVEKNTNVRKHIRLMPTFLAMLAVSSKDGDVGLSVQRIGPSGIISQRLLDGLPLTLAQTFIFPSGWTVIALVILWHSSSIISSRFQHVQYYGLRQNTWWQDISLTCTFCCVLISKCVHTNMLNCEYDKYYACLTWAW